MRVERIEALFLMVSGKVLPRSVFRGQIELGFLRM